MRLKGKVIHNFPSKYIYYIFDYTNDDLTVDSNKKKYEKYKSKNYTPSKHEYIE